jgi:hypothetical protein
MLTALHTYEDVFSEMAFDVLPQCQKWDHAMELEHKPSPGFRKVYLMTLIEQNEMDTFLEEALATSCIRQSKSPLGALVFFIKKKDGKLCFVQDCHTVRGHLSVSLLPLSSPTLPFVHMYFPHTSSPFTGTTLKG